MAAAGAVVAGLLLVLFAVKSMGQVQTWRNSVSVWRACLVADPNNARAHDAYADNLVVQGRFKDAIPHYELVLRRLPDCVETLDAYAAELALGDEKLRDYDRAIRMARQACELTEWKVPDVRRTLAMACASLAVDLERRGSYAQAIELNHRAIRADPSCAYALFSLARLRAACPDETLRRPQEAVRLAEEAWRLVKSPDSTGWMILAAAYIQVEQYHRAAMATEKALELEQSAGNQGLCERLRGQLEDCRQRGRQGGLSNGDR
jgi:tetratricopeptide (TPR) repeat protein